MDKRWDAIRFDEVGVEGVETICRTKVDAAIASLQNAVGLKLITYQAIVKGEMLHAFSRHIFHHTVVCG